MFKELFSFYFILMWSFIDNIKKKTIILFENVKPEIWLFKFVKQINNKKLVNKSLFIEIVKINCF